MTATATHEITCNYVDVCYPDYLQDSHNRDNEILLYASLWDGMIVEDLIEELIDSSNSGPSHFPWGNFSETQIEESIRSEFSNYFSDDSGLILSDFGIEKDEDEDEDDTELPYLYAYLSW